MATSLEKEFRLIRERLDSIEDALAEEISDDDKSARAEALREHKEGKTILFPRRPMDQTFQKAISTSMLSEKLRSIDTADWSG